MGDDSGAKRDTCCNCLLIPSRIMNQCQVRLQRILP
ncbi:unnamed protein product [Fusarium graminearum]|nr:unnamed protein product [Fusarium graminearum]